MAPKRSNDRSSDPNGRKKWLKTSSSSAKKQSGASPGNVVFRVLCPSAKSGSLIGKGGGVVNKIRQETGAKIKIEEAVPGCEERIVVITGSSEVDEEVDAVKNKVNSDMQNDSENADEGNDLAEDNEKTEEKISSSGPSHAEKITSSSHKALLLVFERIAECEPSDDGDEGIKDSLAVTFRMLVESSQVGCLKGKGGSVIKQMSSDSGAQIRILSKDNLPLCASEFDELVQISGRLNETRQAIKLVSRQLLENPSRDGTFSASKLSVPFSSSFGSFLRPEVPHAELIPSGNFLPHIPPFPSRFGEPNFLAPPFQRFPEGPSIGRLQGPPEPLTFRFLCLADMIGGMIGKGGSIIRTIQCETSCDIKVVETPIESESRIIVITGPTHPDDRISPPQDAALRVLERIAGPASDAKDNMVSVRLLVSSNQTGCLLGKGGSIITEMRRTTGAHIRILSKDLIPKGIPGNDEVVQITGEIENVQEALLHITSRLKHHLFRDRLPMMNHQAHPAFLDQSSPFGSFSGRRDISPPGPFNQLGSSLRKFESIGSFRHRDEPLPPALWRTPGISDGVGPISTHDYQGGAPPRRMDGFSGGNRHAIITNTIVDVVVPRSVVSSIYGEDGCSLNQIRQISGADITINESMPGDTETKIIISGAPDQTHAAQSLIQAFVLSETGSE